MTMSQGMWSSMIQNKLLRIIFVCEYVIINSLRAQHLFDEIQVPLASVIMKGVATSMILVAHALFIKLPVAELDTTEFKISNP